MGFLGPLLRRGRARSPRPERFAALPRAARQLAAGGELRPGERAGVLFNPEVGASIPALEGELRGVVALGGNLSGTRVEIELDEFETGWIVLDNRDFGALIEALCAVNETLFARGNGDRLLAAVARVDFERRAAYWIYNYRRGRFHPLVRRGDGDRRDNEAELRLGELMERGRVEVEPSLEHWYGLSGIPF